MPRWPAGRATAPRRAKTGIRKRESGLARYFQPAVGTADAVSPTARPSRRDLPQQCQVGLTRRSIQPPRPGIWPVGALDRLVEVLAKSPTHASTRLRGLTAVVLRARQPSSSCRRTGRLETRARDSQGSLWHGLACLRTRACMSRANMVLRVGAAHHCAIARMWRHERR